MSCQPTLVKVHPAKAYLKCSKYCCNPSRTSHDVSCPHFRVAIFFRSRGQPFPRIKEVKGAIGTLCSERHDGSCAAIQDSTLDDGAWNSAIVYLAGYTK